MVYLIYQRLWGVFLYDLKLPRLKWFLYGNVYTGSFRTDLTKGYFCQTSFNYQVQLIKTVDSAYLAAACYYVLPWNKASNIKEAIIGRFEASAFGIEVCENWIRSKFILDYPTPITDGKVKCGLYNNVLNSLCACTNI